MKKIIALFLLAAFIISLMTISTIAEKPERQGPPIKACYNIHCMDGTEIQFCGNSHAFESHLERACK